MTVSGDDQLAFAYFVGALREYVDLVRAATGFLSAL